MTVFEFGGQNPKDRDEGGNDIGHDVGDDDARSTPSYALAPQDPGRPDVDDDSEFEPGGDARRFYTEDRGETPDRTRPADSDEAAGSLAVRGVLERISDLDPELLEHDDTRQLLEISAGAAEHITDMYGTPDHPRVASGTYEKRVYMSYHNGGEDGHTSVGQLGAGVPRNALVLARAVNDAAGYEVYSVSDRAEVVAAALEHDLIQLCGRTLLDEGQGPDRGDERLTATDARARLLAAGVNPQRAQGHHDLVMVTAWNPLTNTQNVDYAELDANPSDPAVIQRILRHELLAAADLFGPTTRRGPLGTIEYAVERMFLHMNNQLAQQRLHDLGIDPASITSMEQMMEVIGQDEVLRSSFTRILAGDPVFYADNLRYSDRMIRQASGRGVDDLSPLRMHNSEQLALHVLRLQEGRDPIDVWRMARGAAGY